MKCLQCGQEYAAQSPACPRCGFPNLLMNNADSDQGSLPTTVRPSAPSTLQIGSSGEPSSSVREEALRPGMFLGQSRYRLVQRLEYLTWYEGAYEIRWLAQESNGEQVLLCEVMLSMRQAKERQTALHNMIRVANAASRHRHLPQLLQTFREQERDFFVFQWFQVETLQDCMKRTRRPLSEQDLLRLCTSILNEPVASFVLQNPPVVHGLINPGHLFLTNDAWALSNCSLILASQQFQSIAPLDWTIRSPYLPPEIGPVQRILNGQLDIYSILATAYFALTGTAPQDREGGRSTPVRQKNPLVSESLERILAKGLDPSPDRRYRSVSELQYDMQALSNVTPLALEESQRVPLSTSAATQIQPIQTSTKQSLPDVLKPSSEQAEGPFEPLNNLSAFVAGNDRLDTLWWLLGILGVSLLLILLK